MLTLFWPPATASNKFVFVPKLTLPFGLSLENGYKNWQNISVEALKIQNNIKHSLMIFAQKLILLINFVDFWYLIFFENFSHSWLINRCHTEVLIFKSQNVPTGLSFKSFKLQDPTLLKLNLLRLTIHLLLVNTGNVHTLLTFSPPRHTHRK